MINKKRNIIIAIVLLITFLIPIIAFAIKSSLLNIEAEDSLSGVDKIVLPNKKEIKADQAKFAITENGEYKFKAYDRAGNKAEKKVTINNIKKPVPKITILNFNTAWTNQDIKVEATVENGILDQSNFIVNNNGTITFRATNKDGNIIEETFKITNIDKEKPVLDISLSTFEPTNKDVKIKVKGFDNLSGIEKIILPDETKVNSDQAEYLAQTNGEYKFKAYDRAGNKAEKKVTVNNIDKKLNINEKDHKQYLKTDPIKADLIKDKDTKTINDKQKNTKQQDLVVDKTSTEESKNFIYKVYKNTIGKLIHFRKRPVSSTLFSLLFILVITTPLIIKIRKKKGE